MNERSFETLLYGITANVVDKISNLMLGRKMKPWKDLQDPKCIPILKEKKRKCGSTAPYCSRNFLMRNARED